jgi:rhodanese-related sulfurtransferase
MKSITPKQLEELQEKKENITIVDVRTPEEYN